MCGRYGRFSRKERVEAVLGRAIYGADELDARYNICPGEPDWVIRQSYRTRRFGFERWHWGLLASWAKDARSARRPINARAETVAEKPMFRQLLRDRRCVVPIDGYYEWRTTSSGKVPFWFSLNSREPFFLAGLWDVWHKGKPDAVASYILMTTKPNELAAPVHDRMPVLLHARDVALWLDPTVTDSEAVAHLLAPYPADEMQAYRVSPRVNAPANDGAELIAPDTAPAELWDSADAHGP